MVEFIKKLNYFYQYAFIYAPHQFSVHIPRNYKILTLYFLYIELELELIDFK